MPTKEGARDAPGTGTHLLCGVVWLNEGENEKKEQEEEEEEEKMQEEEEQAEEREAEEKVKEEGETAGEEAMGVYEGLYEAMATIGVYEAVANATGLRATDVKKSVVGLMHVAAAHLKTQGSFTLRGLMSLKLHEKKARPVRHLRTAKTNKPCITKATPAHNTVSGRKRKNRFQGFYD